MLTENDIDFMEESLDEIYELRERPVVFYYFERVYDEITEEIIEEKEVPLEASAVVTEISTKSKDGDRGISGGIEYEAGDAKFDVKIENLKGVAVLIERIEYDGESYEILGDDKKGIGVRNRIEFIGRVIT